MAATKGNKALQSHAQKLGEQVTNMSAKIKELESALATAHLQIQTQSDPPEDAAAKKGCTGSRRRSYGVGAGSLAINSEGLARYYGDTSESEYFFGLLPNGGGYTTYYEPDLQELNLSPEIILLYNAYPFGLRSRLYTKNIFISYLPRREEAMQTIEIFYDRFGFLHNPVSYEDCMEDLIGSIYGSSNVPSVEHVHPHKLAVFLGILAIGHQRSVDFETSQGLNLNAERYYVLSCAALCLTPIMAEAMCATVQALFLVDRYVWSSTRRACEELWLLIGVMARVALRIGLHRDGAQFNLDAAELRRRRLIFWELYRLDAWMSFVTGRAPAINLSDTDTKFPEYDGDPNLMSYPYWKYRHAAACLWPTIKLAAAEVASYEDIMALDRKIRTFPVPTHLQASLQGSTIWQWSTDAGQAIQQYCIVADKELNLLFLHRNYVAVALHSGDPLAHKFGGSVLAVYRCATRMCFALRDLYKLHPRTISGMWHFWSGIFSACIVLAAIPIVAPSCALAQNALTNFKAARRLFIEGAASCHNPNTVEILQKLERRAENNLMAYWSDPLKYRCIPALPGEIDELRLLGGQEIVIQQAARSLSRSPAPLSSQVSHMRAQPHHAQPHGNMSGAFNDAAGTSASSPLMPVQSFDVGLDEFDFTDLEGAFLSSTIPSYEQIMQTTSAGPYPGSSMRTHDFSPDPSRGFHPANFPQNSGSGRPEHAEYPPRGQQHMSGLGSADFDCGPDVWSSFVGDLTGSSQCSPSQYGI
ncbi:uncharacterized protein PHACADRAFT_213749 [Phanerochaete carnosa HHB-10118-sp]|uniref:Xylanolytic transcriptional activator regulatory domain-containing protein n=1 Tax=Phanerochaete carnosa (strain HHB-10118-sp) TaxID=650164 RepID=K5VFN5_PHACS|nr:uncharacterized protein PHACADRAFT_213749 [Phanerochaete carnosa HHB-10118-sp]EKM49978.1 hypothetical protein PHACADRAFT_213749 [Phanerochaete carnosa HHB-10118-sp]